MVGKQCSPGCWRKSKCFTALKALLLGAAVVKEGYLQGKGHIWDPKGCVSLRAVWWYKGEEGTFLGGGESEEREEEISLSCS